MNVKRASRYDDMPRAELGDLSIQEVGDFLDTLKDRSFGLAPGEQRFLELVVDRYSRSLED